jgi:hypothetical protein
VLLDLPFSRNQPLKSADDQRIKILKEIWDVLGEIKIGHCGLNRVSGLYLYVP